MSFKQKAGLAALLAGLSGCVDNNQDTDLECNLPPPLFQDVTGDGRPDLVYGVNVRLWFSHNTDKRYNNTTVYEVYAKENLGNMAFADKPTFILRTYYEPGVQLLYFREEDSGLNVFENDTHKYVSENYKPKK